MKPGSTIVLAASITAASALMSGRTAAIRSPSIRTSAGSKSPTLRSRLSTTPPLIGVRGCWAKAGRAALASAAAPAHLTKSRRRMPEVAAIAWRSVRLDRAVRTRLIDGARQVLRQHIEQLIHRQAHRLRHLVDLL